MTRHWSPNRDDRNPRHCPAKASSWNPLIKRTPGGPDNRAMSFHGARGLAGARVQSRDPLLAPLRHRPGGAARTHRRPHRYILRFPLLIGLTHLFLVWNGDILTLYALGGLVVAPLLRLPTRGLLGLSIVFFALQIAPVPYPQPFATAADLREHVEAAGHVYRYGTFAQALTFRIKEVRPTSPTT